MEIIDNLEVRRHRLFTDFYTTAWDLATRLTRVKAQMEKLGESYRGWITGMKLVLYPKRKFTWMEPSALHWGMTISALRSGPLDSRGKRTRRIKHQAGPLSDTRIHFGGGDARRRQLYDFDRRRLALNAAHRAVTYATMTTLKALRGCSKKLPGPKDPAPLPPDHCMVQLRPSGVESAGLAWRLVSALVDSEAALYWLTEELQVHREPDRIDLRFEAAGGPLGGPTAAWHLWQDGRVVEKLTYKILRRSRVPQARHQQLASFEFRRRKIEKVRTKHVKLICRLKGLCEEASAEADRNLAEASRVLVDEYDRPIEGCA